MARRCVVRAFGYGNPDANSQLKVPQPELYRTKKDGALKLKGERMDLYLKTILRVVDYRKTGITADSCATHLRPSLPFKPAAIQ